MPRGRRSSSRAPIHHPGGPDVLRYDDVPVPELGPGEVLVRVHAAGVNPPDWYLREGMKVMPPELRPTLKFPLIPGTDLSGVVQALAPDVRGFAVGDEVFGMLRFPGHDGRTYAEYVAAPALKRGGTMLPVFFARYDPDETASRGITVSSLQVRSNGPQLAEIGRLLDEGTLRIEVDSTYPLPDAAGAHTRAAHGHLQGKIVLTVAP